MLLGMGGMRSSLEDSSPFAPPSEADWPIRLSEIDFLTMLEDHDYLLEGQVGSHGSCLVHQTAPRGSTDDPCCVARTDRRLGMAVS